MFASADGSWKEVGGMLCWRNLTVSVVVGVQFTLWTFQSNNRNTVYKRASPLKWKEQRRQVLHVHSILFDPMARFKGQLLPRILYREYWMISRGAGFSCGRKIRLLTHPSPVSKLSLFLGLPACRRSSLLTGEGGGGVVEEPNHKTARESRAFYKSFNPLWYFRSIPHFFTVKINKNWYLKLQCITCTSL